MRFFDTDLRPLCDADIRIALQEIDPAFDVDGGFLLYAGEWYAEISIDGAGTDYFGSEVRMLLSGLETNSAPERERVEATLHNAQREICLRVLYGGRATETTMARLDALWDWLFASRAGLLHAEGEGFYENETLILAIE